MIDIKKEQNDYSSYMKLKNFSRSTRESYVSILGYFLEFFNVHFPGETLSQDQAKAYIVFRYDQGKAWQTMNADYSSLRKYFREVRNFPWSMKKLPRPRKERSLPRILSQEEVVRIIEAAPNFKYQVFLTFLYSTGMRLGEAIKVTFDDIDSDRLQIRINKGKGAKDRFVQVPECLIILLRDYYKRYKPKQYLFNGKRKGTHYSHSAGQWAIKQGRVLAKITKHASTHTLRHCYATHHLENGTDLVFLQEQLGHKHLKTTAKYIHLCVERYRQINHPIERLQIKYR